MKGRYLNGRDTWSMAIYYVINKKTQTSVWGKMMSWDGSIVAKDSDYVKQMNWKNFSKLMFSTV